MTDSPALLRIGHQPEAPAPRKRRWWPLFAAIAVLLMLAGAASMWWVMRPTGTASPTSAVAPDDRSMEAAQRMAQAEMDAFTSGDYAGAWDLWSARGKSAISRTDYIRLNTECKPLQGLPFVIKSIRPEGDGAVFIAERGGLTFSFALVFEDHGWRFIPPAENLAGYAKGVDALIAEKKAADSCF